MVAPYAQFVAGKRDAQGGFLVRVVGSTQIIEDSFASEDGIHWIQEGVLGTVFDRRYGWIDVRPLDQEDKL